MDVMKIIASHFSAHLNALRTFKKILRPGFIINHLIIRDIFKWFSALKRQRKDLSDALTKLNIAYKIWML
jgi:3-methyladenine DNA glycosylase AlkC